MGMLKESGNGRACQHASAMLRIFWVRRPHRGQVGMSEDVCVCVRVEKGKWGRFARIDDVIPSACGRVDSSGSTKHGGAGEGAEGGAPRDGRGGKDEDDEARENAPTRVPQPKPCPSLISLFPRTIRRGGRLSTTSPGTRRQSRSRDPPAPRPRPPARQRRAG